MFKKLFILFILVIILMFYFSKDAITLSVAVPNKIRVAVIENADTVEIAVKGPYKITTIETEEVLKEGKFLWQAIVSPTEHGLDFKTHKTEHLKVYGIQITPEDDPSVYVNDFLYRGVLQLIKTKDGSFSVVNILNIEDYIKGVLYHEVSPHWPIETIKAQAIASRTFAIYKAQERSGRDYFLSADVGSQRYKGVFAEKTKTNKAVDQTRGMVLMYHGKILPTFFHAACGGRTEKASRLWNISKSIKPLKGVRCNFCKNSPYFKWKRKISLDKLGEKISKKKGVIGKIKHIKVLSKNKSGRVSKVKIYTKLVKDLILTTKELRNTVGARLLKSTNFNVTIADGYAHFNGYGWGHGVGMCQWGAFAMAKKRYSYARILKTYYPGARIVKLKI